MCSGPWKRLKVGNNACAYAIRVKNGWKCVLVTLFMCFQFLSHVCTRHHLLSIVSECLNAFLGVTTCFRAWPLIFNSFSTIFSYFLAVFIYFQPFSLTIYQFYPFSITYSSHLSPLLKQKPPCHYPFAKDKTTRGHFLKNTTSKGAAALLSEYWDKSSCLY